MEWINNCIHFRVWVEFLIDSRNSMMQPLKFGNGYIIHPIVYWSCNSLYVLGLKLIYVSKTGAHEPLTRYVKLRVAHAPGMPGTFFPPQRVSDPDMHPGTCVPWCMPGLLTSGFRWSRWCNPQFCISGKRPMLICLTWSSREISTWFMMSVSGSVCSLMPSYIVRYCG